MSTLIKVTKARSFLKSVLAIANDLDEGFSMSQVKGTLDKETGEVTFKLSPTDSAPAKKASAKKTPAKKTPAKKAPASKKTGNADEDKFNTRFDQYDMAKMGVKKSIFNRKIVDSSKNVFFLTAITSKGADFMVTPEAGGKRVRVASQYLIDCLKNKERPDIRGGKKAPAKKAPAKKTTAKKTTAKKAPKDDIVNVVSADLTAGKNLTSAQKTALKKRFTAALPKAKKLGVTAKHFFAKVKVSSGTGNIVGIITKNKKARVFIKSTGKIVAVNIKNCIK